MEVIEKRILHLGETYSITNLSRDVRAHQGKDHWILPVVMMVEGVHNGSRGPVLYTTDELSRNLQAWNGMPIMIGHPADEGGPVSAREPNFADIIVGRVYNAHMDGKKLKAEAWVDIQQLGAVDAEAHQYILDDRAVEVSVGVFSDEEKSEGGDFNGENYRAAAVNLRPDHLALLPGGEGACSWDDGCGLRVNKQSNQKGEINVKSLKDVTPEELVTFKETHLADLITNIVSNDTGFREIMTNVQQKLDQMDNDLHVYFLEELFDDDFVYRVHNRQTQETRFFKQAYVAQTEDGVINFSGDPTPVRKETSFVNLSKRTKFPQNKKGGKMQRTKTPCSVDALISNEANQFTDADREWLNELDADQLARFAPVVNEPEPEPKKPEPEKKVGTPIEALVSNENGTILIGGKPIGDLVKEVLSNEENPEVFIETFMPEGLKGQMKAGLAMYHEKRGKLIEGIVANSNFKEENLKKWVDEDLTNLYQSVVPKADFSARGEAPLSNNEHAEEVEAMLNFGQEAEKKGGE